MGNLLVSPVTEKETHRGETCNGEVVYAVSSMQGWRVHMEDAHICQPVLFAEELITNTSDVSDQNASENGGLVKKAKTENDESKDQTQSQFSNGSSNAAADISNVNTDVDAISDASNKYRKIELPNHSLFAVFDGHGGSFAAQYSGLNFTRVLSRQPSFVQYAHFLQEQNTTSVNASDASNSAAGNSTATSDSTQQQAQQAQIHRKGIELLEQAFRDAFLDLDREIWRVVNHCTNQDCIIPTKNNNHMNNSNPNESDDDDHDIHNDEYSFSQEDSGTTAVAVMLTPQYIICANAGDSRSVYSKQGNSVIPLSYDHKPDDEAEERRIVEAGGFVRVGRVDGDLAVSRGLGDFRFKEHELYKAMGTTAVADLPFLNNSNMNSAESRSKKRGSDNNPSTSVEDGYQKHLAEIILPDEQKVSPIPDVITQKRDHNLDEFVVVACDGIFDVQTNNECIAMTAEIFQEGEQDLGLVCEEVCFFFIVFLFYSSFFLFIPMRYYYFAFHRFLTNV